MSYEILKHPSDAKFRAIGKTLEDAFKEATKAFSEIVGEDPESGETRHKTNIESENQQALLYDYLNRLVFIQDANGVAVTHAKNLSIEEKKEGYKLEGAVYVDDLDPGRSYMDIKSPTYNQMKVDYQQGEGWILEAVLDI